MMSQLTLATVNPLDVDVDVKSLFASHGDDRFATWFDRAYRLAAHHGSTAWTGRSADGMLKMYIARLDRQFLLDGAVVRGGNVANMFVAQEARTFFPALALVRRLIRDTRGEGVIDFLYGTPNERFAPVSLAAGLQQAGAMARLVLPLGDTSAIRDAVLDVLHLCRYAAASTRRVERQDYSAVEYDVRRSEAPPTTRGLELFRPREMYSYRLDDYPGDEYRWYEYRRRRDCKPVGTFLMHLPQSDIATIRAQRIYRRDEIGTVMSDMAFRLRRRGYRRLQTGALASSPLYTTLRRAGFFHRPEDRALHALGITDRGKRAVAALGAAGLEPIDCDR